MNNEKELRLIESIRSSYCIDDRYDHFDYLLSKISLDGLFLEFGVREGDSINYLAGIISPKIIYGFDSFEGLPEAWVRRKDGSLTYSVGTFANEKLPNVLDNVVLIKGWFSDTLPTFANKNKDKVAFINIDSDLYSSAKTILTVLNEYIIPGTILYFDEITGWGELINEYDNWQDGEYKALLEWLDQFDREVEPVSRNNRYGAALKVTR